MDSKELIRAGRLSEARTQLIEEVRSSPADAGKRTLLFQVHSFLGEWEKADRHLDVIAAQDSSRETGVQIYKNLVHAERERLEVFDKGRRPSFLPKAPPYIEIYYDACGKLAEKKIEEAREQFDKIDALIPVISGTVNNRNFTGLRDTDIFLSFFLEAIAHERYVWIPFESVRELSIAPPASLFDLIWAQTRITTWEGLTLNCFLPVCYAGSYIHEDERVRLGRMTDWIALGGPYYRGAGQHVYQIGEEDTPILDIREIIFDPPGAKG